MSSLTQMSDPCPLDNVDVDSMMLMMRRRMVPLDDILDSVPKPPNTVPRDGLPLWDHMPLDQKLSMPPTAYGKVVFARGKLGEDLSKPSTDKKLKPEFNLSLLKAPLLEYDALHDPHLRCFFARAPNLRHVQRCGLATQDGLAVCTLHQFNEHRARLHVWYMDAVKREMALIDERARDSLALSRAARDAARRRAAYMRGERVREQQRRVIERQREEQLERERKLAESQAMSAARSARVKEARRESLRAARRAGLARTAIINARVQAGVELDVRKRLRAARAARQDGIRRARNARRKREQREREKTEKSEEAWQRRMANERNRLCLEARVSVLREQDAEAGAARRARRARATHDKLEEQLECARARRRTELSQSQITVQSAAGKAKSNALARMAGETIDPQASMERARMRMEYDENTPAPVSSVLQDALGRAVATCARRRIFVLVRDLHLAVLARSLRSLDLQVPDYADVDSSTRRKSQVRPRRSLLMTRAIVHEEANAHEHASNPSGDFTDSITKPENSANSRQHSSSGYMETLVEELLPGELMERKNMLRMVNLVAKYLSRDVRDMVGAGIDLLLKKVTMPKPQRIQMEPFEHIDALTELVVSCRSRVMSDAPELRHAARWMSYELLKQIRAHIVESKNEEAVSGPKNFYNPEEQAV